MFTKLQYTFLAHTQMEERKKKHAQQLLRFHSAIRWWCMDIWMYILSLTRINNRWSVKWSCYADATHMLARPKGGKNAGGINENRWVVKSLAKWSTKNPKRLSNIMIHRSQNACRMLPKNRVPMLSLWPSVRWGPCPACTRPSCLVAGEANNSRLLLRLCVLVLMEP